MLAHGEYYLCDLVGLGVFGAEGLVGHVVEVQMYPSVDAVVIQTPAGEWVEQPLLDEWIEQVDLAAQRIVLSSLGGLIEVPRGARPADQSSTDSSKR
jgi:ribosomal 30S subunit maturation factor RimM